MTDLTQLIGRATAPALAESRRHQAFGELVRRYQDLAFGCAFAILSDFQLAEDAAQEAFIAAWRNLDQLKTPDAFPGWLKRIVHSRCNRFLRQRDVETVALSVLEPLTAGSDTDPPAVVEQKETRDRIALAIDGLPEHERMVTALFYINDTPQKEIAEFLELPLTTVKKRLHSARKRLMERMLDMVVRDGMQERRPSRDDRFVNMVTLYNQALETFLARVKQDRNIIAVVLFGSLATDDVWKKSDIDLFLVCRNEKQAEQSLYLVENGVNIHAQVINRAQFRRAIDGALDSSIFQSCLAVSSLLYCTDDSVRDLYESLGSVGDRDRDLQLLKASGCALAVLAKAEKYLYLKKDVEYSFLWIMHTVGCLASIEVLLHGTVTRREVIHQALQVNPRFFKAVYTDLIHGEKSAESLQRALNLINEYIDSKIPLLFGLVIKRLSEADMVMSTSELDHYFRKQAQTASLGHVYEWLADRGILQKVPSPIKLTDKSTVAVVDESAYYYNAHNAGVLAEKLK